MKRYGFLYFAKNIATHLSNKYSQKHLDGAQKARTDRLKTASKRAFQKTAEATGNLIGNKIPDKIASSSKELHSKNNSETDENELDIPKERYISPEKRQQIIDELRLT